MAERPFTRFAVFWRSVALSEARLAELPWVIVAPVVGSFLGTAWALSEPAQPVREGHVVPLSFGDVILPAALGGVGGAFGVWLLLFAYVWVRYRVRGDPVWKSSYIRPDFTNDVVYLDPGILAKPKLPDRLITIVSRRSGRRYIPPISTTIGVEKGAVTIGQPARPGEYECRWYCDIGRFRGELARARFVVPEPDEPPDEGHDDD
jgi:hypothetical protein